MWYVSVCKKMLRSSNLYPYSSSIWKRRAVSKSSCNFCDVSPTYTHVKSNRNFFIITFDWDRNISINCVWRWCLLKHPLTKLKNAIIYLNMAVSRGWVKNQWYIARWQFCDIRFGHRIMGVVSSFDYEIHTSIQIIFHLAHKWSKCVVSEFSEIMWHKWYFCKFYMIKWKRDSGISVADTAEILIPLSCSKTSICKLYYQVSHPYNDVEKENRSHDRKLLNTVGMGQDSRISKCWCSEDITVLHLAIGTFQDMHHHYAIHSHCASWDIVLDSIYPWDRARLLYLYSWSTVYTPVLFEAPDFLPYHNQDIIV